VRVARGLDARTRLPASPPGRYRAPMTVTVHVPGALRAYSDGARELSLSAPSVGEALAQLERRYPSLYRSVCDETGAVRRHVNVFVQSSNVRDLDGVKTPLTPGDVVTILPAVSGG